MSCLNNPISLGDYSLIVLLGHTSLKRLQLTPAVSHKAITQLRKGEKLLIRKKRERLTFLFPFSMTHSYVCVIWAYLPTHTLQLLGVANHSIIFTQVHLDEFYVGVEWLRYYFQG